MKNKMFIVFDHVIQFESRSVLNYYDQKNDRVDIFIRTAGETYGRCGK